MSILNTLKKDLGSSKDTKRETNPVIQAQIQEELDFWGGGYVTEVDPSAYPRLKKYWDYVNFGSNWTPSGTPWSSAFISYALRGQDFPKTASHYKYIEQIINNPNSGWEAFDLEKTDNLVLNVGDVLIRPRTGANTDQYSTHGDLVYKIANGKAQLVGGNVSNSAKVVKYIGVDENNRATNSVFPYVVILKKNSKKALGMLPIFLAIGALTFFGLRKRK